MSSLYNILAEIGSILQDIIQLCIFIKKKSSDTGLPTKDATSTMTVESFVQSFLKNYVDYKRSLTVFLFSIFL